MRKNEFKKAVVKPVVFNDSRFGIRRLFINKQERPRVAMYRQPGKGVKGESQNQRLGGKYTAFALPYKVELERT